MKGGLRTDSVNIRPQSLEKLAVPVLDATKVGNHCLKVWEKHMLHSRKLDPEDPTVSAAVNTLKD